MTGNRAPDVEALIQAIQKDIYNHPESVLRPLRQLLQLGKSDEELCYVYGQLGFAYLLLGEHRMSKIFCERALQLQPDHVQVLGNIAHAACELGERARGVEYGRRALRLKDEMAIAAGRLDIGKPHGGSINLVSYSLYGSKARYCETALLNCVAAKQHLPAFVCRFYVDESVPADVIRRLRDHSAEIVPVRGRAASFFPTFWRFLALDDEHADRVLVRDADSLIDAREAYCIREWLDSGKPFHIIRDDGCHTELIHAGLFGARSGIVDRVEDRIATFIATERNEGNDRFSDQLFLRKCVWPMVREHALTHDSIYGYGADVRAIPSDVPDAPGLRNAFIGANYANYRVQLSTQHALAESGLYFLRIIDQAGRTVCESPMDRVATRELQIFLPQAYAKLLESGAWRCEIFGRPP
jgi:hypothetical protein